MPLAGTIGFCVHVTLRFKLSRRKHLQDVHAAGVGSQGGSESERALDVPAVGGWRAAVWFGDSS